MPVIASTHDALRESSTSTSPRPRSNQSAARAASKVMSGAAFEDRQAQPPDRSGDGAAVGDELVERLVRDVADVHLHAVDQQLERVERKLVALVGMCQCDGDRI